VVSDAKEIEIRLPNKQRLRWRDQCDRCPGRFSSRQNHEVTLTIFRSGETVVGPVKLGNKPRALDEHEG
jgi:hypothetical protein